MVQSFNDLQERQRRYLEDRGWLDQTPKSISMSIGIEAAELMEVYQWDADRPAAALQTEDEVVERTREEVADVLIYCMNLALVMDIDLLDAVEAKLAINESRD